MLVVSSRCAEKPGGAFRLALVWGRFGYATGGNVSGTQLQVGSPAPGPVHLQTPGCDQIQPHCTPASLQISFRLASTGIWIFTLSGTDTSTYSFPGSKSPVSSLACAAASPPSMI